MKIVYFGNNLFSACLQHLIAEGHQILRVYKNSAPHDTSNIDRLCGNNIPQSDHKPSLSELNELILLGAQMFIVAEYSHLLPITDVSYAINIHPTLLPNGRGPTPLPYLIKSPEFSGVTLHKIAADFDSGDIILQAKIAQSSDESLTTLMIKMHLEAVTLLKVFFENVAKHYQDARSQSDYTHWPMINASQRVLDWHLPISNLKTLIRSFGHFGVIIKLNEKLWKTTQVEVIDYQHNLLPGKLLFEDNNLLAISALDGIVCIHKSSISAIENQNDNK
ncbi:MAG: methionyl-tRNA formyltransferase [Colwellia sp.]|nr:methionyl-tRNA formyltransferase [Colwellia sp.]